MTADRPSLGDALADDTVLRSHDLAELAGTTPRALRHYHAIGLLPEVPRDANGYRRYGPNDLVRVLRIRQLAASGMPLRKIGSILEQDLQSQDELLAELDRELREQAEHIEAQRRMLAQLRMLSQRIARFSTPGRTTAVERLDQDLWTLVTATGGLDPDTASTILDVLHSEPMADQAATWYPEFTQLETHHRIDPTTADRLAHRMADFADAVLSMIGGSPPDGNPSVMALVEQMQAEALSPAQQDVWDRFACIVEDRWTSPATRTPAVGDQESAGTGSAPRSGA